MYRLVTPWQLADQPLRPPPSPLQSCVFDVVHGRTCSCKQTQEVLICLAPDKTQTLSWQQLPSQSPSGAGRRKRRGGEAELIKMQTQKTESGTFLMKECCKQFSYMAQMCTAKICPNSISTCLACR